MKNLVKKAVRKDSLELARSATLLLSKQGNLLKSLEDEVMEIGWKAVIYNTPKDFLAFGV